MTFNSNFNSRTGHRLAAVVVALAVAGLTADEPSAKPASRAEATAIIANARKILTPNGTRGFRLVFAFFGPALYALTEIGLFYRIRFAGFLAWFIVIGPGVAESTHFIFLVLRPAPRPETPQTTCTQPGPTASLACAQLCCR